MESAKFNKQIKVLLGWGVWDGVGVWVFPEFLESCICGHKRKKYIDLTGIPVTFRAYSLHASMCQRMCLKIAHVATMYMSLPFSVMLLIYLSFARKHRFGYIVIARTSNIF